MAKRKDRLTVAQRSYCMSQVKSKDTKIERLIRSGLFKKGYRFRKHVKSLPGSPDIVFPSKKIAVFIDGEFWHGKNHKKWLPGMKPYWIKKITGNIQRDRKNSRGLKKLGWIVIRIWEKEANKNLEKQISRLENLLN